METRKITIVSSLSQSRKDIMSAATTLSELKADLDRANINYDGMTFMEGYSKTELKTDDSILPSNIPLRNGTVTNELVFMLTAPQKKIKSGAMTRQECYTFMQDHTDLASEFKTLHGYPYTNASTASLSEFIEDAKTASNKVLDELHYVDLKEALDIILQKMLSLGELTLAEYASVVSILSHNAKSSDLDIDEMFAFLND